MRWFTRKINELRRRENGAVAVTTALLLVGLVGFLGLSVDLGVLYAARAELQNAADAAAMAGAATMVVADAQNNAITQCDVATSTAQAVSAANTAIGQSIGLRPEDITMGYWDGDLGGFDPSRTGPSNDPNDLTAFNVFTRRDDLANGPVTTYFAGIFGLTESGVSATSTAYLGYAGSVQPAGVTLPIAVDEGAVSGGSGNPLCGQSIEFHSENQENGSWTSFFTWPANNPNVDHYACGCWDSPEIKVGDYINITNGNLSNNTFNHMRQRFYQNQVGGEWAVNLPVVAAGTNNGPAEVVGFATMIITEINSAPQKNVVGYLKCGMVVPGSETGGENFGSRASAPKLLNTEASL